MWDITIAILNVCNLNIPQLFCQTFVGITGIITSMCSLTIYKYWFRFTTCICVAGTFCWVPTEDQTQVARLLILCFIKLVGIDGSHMQCNFNYFPLLQMNLSRVYIDLCMWSNTKETYIWPILNPPHWLPIALIFCCSQFCKFIYWDSNSGLLDYESGFLPIDLKENSH